MNKKKNNNNKNNQSSIWGPAFHVQKWPLSNPGHVQLHKYGVWSNTPMQETSQVFFTYLN